MNIPLPINILGFDLQANIVNSSETSIWIASNASKTVIIKLTTRATLYQAETQAMKSLAGVRGIAQIVAHCPNMVILNTVVNAIAMEYYPRGDLCTLIKSPAYNQHDESNVRSLFIAIANAVKECHSRDIVHLDIKPDNVFLDATGRPVLGDFGFAICGNVRSLNKFRGTMSYMAPEVRGRLEYGGKAADIFSLGVTLYILLLKKYPFWNKSSFDLFSTKPDKYWATLSHSGIVCSNEFKPLFSAMVHLQPINRPSIEAILAHPWLLG